jgi:hypothetical protein
MSDSNEQVIEQLSLLIDQMQKPTTGPSADAVDLLMKHKWFTLMGEVRFQTARGILVAMVNEEGEESTEWLPRSQCRVTEIDLKDGEGPVLMLQVKSWIIDKNPGKYVIGPHGFQYIPEKGLELVAVGGA